MNLVSAVIQLFANAMNKLFVRSKIVPEHPLDNLGIDANKPTVYITLLNSFADAAALQTMCKKLGLPDPQINQQIGEHQVPRYIPIHHRSPLFGSVKIESPALSISENIFNALKQSDVDDRNFTTTLNKYLSSSEDKFILLLILIFIILATTLLIMIIIMYGG